MELRNDFPLFIDTMMMRVLCLLLGAMIVGFGGW